MSSISGLDAAAAACGRDIESDFVGCLINDKDQIKVSDQPQPSVFYNLAFVFAS